MGCASLSPPYEAANDERKGRGTPTAVQPPPPPSGGGAHPGGIPSPVGVPPRLFLRMSEHPRPASGQASWDAAATLSSLDGRYPPLPVPVQWHPRPATNYR